MKYFTSEWWATGCKGDAFQRYRAYFASVQDRLPAEAVRLDAEHTLHDSEVKIIRSDFSNRKVVLELLGFDQQLKYQVRYILSFSGVSHFEQKYPPEEYVESELGDLGYWEWEPVKGGTELRMLFASSAEFVIVFTDLAFRHERFEA